MDNDDFEIDGLDIESEIAEASKDHRQAASSTVIKDTHEASAPRGARTGLASLQDKVQEIWSYLLTWFQDFWAGLPKLAQVGVLGGVVLVGLLIMVLAWPRSQAIEVVAEPSKLDSLSRTFGDLVLPNIPQQLEEGFPEAPFQPLPRWNLSDLAVYLPNIEELLGEALRRKNSQEYEQMLQMLP